MIDSIDMMRMLELNEVMDGQSVSVIYENSCVVSTDYRHVDRQTGIPLLSRPTRMNIFVFMLCLEGDCVVQCDMQRCHIVDGTLFTCKPGSILQVEEGHIDRITDRLTKGGSAVGGFAGADAIRRSNCLILTDSDLFPPGTISLNGIKIFGEESGKVISYAATMARAAESGLARLFDDLLLSEGGFHEQVTDVEFFEEGGVGGTIHGESVLLGIEGFFRKKGIILPHGLKLKTGVFLAVDGTLIAIFAVKYHPAENVDWALHALHRNRITPVLAVRDGNITPLLLKRKFGTDARAVYPKLSTRLALSEHDGDRPYALLLREGLTPYAEVAVGSKRLCRAVRVGSFLSLLSSVLGTLLAFYLTFVSAQRALSPLTMLSYLLLWAIAALIDGFFVDRY